MPKSCCVPGCTANKAKQPQLKFYIIPVEETRRKIWLQAIRRARVHSSGVVKLNQVWSPKSNHAYVCSQHFVAGEKSNDRNHPDYVPSVFPHRTGNKSVTTYTDRKRRAEDRTSQAKKRLQLTTVTDGESVDNDNDELNSSFSTLAEPLPTDLRPQPVRPLEPSERESLYTEIRNLRQERDQALEEVKRLRKKLENCGMSSNSIEDNDEKTEMMTGLTWPVFIRLYLYLTSFVRNQGMQGGRRDSMPQRDQLFLTLVKLRQGVTFDFLAHICGSPQSTVINYFWKWMDLMHAKVGFMVKWPERENLHTIIPPVFKNKFPKLTSIIDCFEIFIDAPRNLLARAQCYSNYKKHTTVKIFISCNPYGQINFISNAWGGRASDIQIVRDSGFIDPKYHFPCDQILADRGFTLHEDFATVCSAELIMPAFTKGHDQLPAREVENSRKISNVRIHIERVIGLMKNRFTILQGPIPIRCIQRLKDEANAVEYSNIDKLINVCAALTNLTESIVYSEDETND